MFIFRWIFKAVFKIIIFLAVLVIILLVIFNWPTKSKNEEMIFNVSFSDIFAEQLGLDWKETYLAILDDLRPQKVRVAAYWWEIEKEQGVYDFSDLDWQVQTALEKNTDLVLAMGMKVPRWPECYIPQFYWDDKEKREKALFEYLTVLVNRYKSYENIKIWQIENEPFLPFGYCPFSTIEEEFVDREIELVRSIDNSRPIMITDSGEISYWHKAAKRADIFGTTLYKTIHKEPFGYFEYPIGPNFFRVKAFLIGIFSSQKNVVICELQAEPWGPAQIYDMDDLNEHFKSMNAEKLAKMADFARKTNFSESYLWGAEWWYWLKTKKDLPEVWDTAKEIVN